MKMPDSSERQPLDRRQFLALGVGGLVLAALPHAAATARGLVTRSVPVMGTIADLRVAHDDRALAERAIDAAVEELYRVDRAMTRFSRLSEVGRANLEAASRPVAVSAATAAVVERALFWAERTGGSFDPCLGEACALWDVTHRHVPPPSGEVHRFAGRALYRQLEVSRRAGGAVLFYHTPDLALDLGGIAKGWAVDRAVDALRAHGIRNAIVEAGGDLYAMGHSERGDDWEIGVQSPTNPHAIVARFPLRDAAVATSGDYQQYFDFHGRRYHHLLDPGTGAPRQTSEHSVSVQAPSCLDADAGATAVFGAPRAKAQALLARAVDGARLIHSA